MKNIIIIIVLIFSFSGFAQSKTAKLKFTNGTYLEITELYVFSKWNRGRGKNFLVGKVLKPKETIEINVPFEKEKRCKRNIRLIDDYDFNVKFENINPCDQDHIVLMVYDLPVLMNPEATWIRIPSSF